MKIPAVATALLLALASPPLLAQTVYRCGPDGRSYSDRPCSDGRTLDVGDARAADQRREARAAAAAERRLAQDLAVQRRERERLALAEAGGAAGFARPPAAEFSPPPARTLVQGPSGRKKAKARRDAHVTWQATSPPPSRP